MLMPRPPLVLLGRGVSGAPFTGEMKVLFWGGVILPDAVPVLLTVAEIDNWHMQIDTRDRQRNLRVAPPDHGHP